MPTIDIRIKDKIAMQTGGGAVIGRDNSDYVINFTFDVEWAEETAKTARFALQRGGYMDVPFTGSSVAVPVISTGRRVDVGVFAGNLRTTTSATLPLVPSIRSKGGAPVPPEDAVYDKLIALINSMGEISDDDIKQAVEDYLSANPIAAASMRVEAGYIQYSTDDGKTWVNLIAEADLKGDKGDKGADGTDGITPHIGENGNWYIGSTDTGNPSRGATGPQGPAGAPGKDGADMGITGAKVGQIAKIAAVDASGVPAAWSPVDMPEALPNPNALTFTGAVTGSYDGSAPLEVSIPSGGGGTGGGGDVFELIGEATSSGVSDASGLTIPFDGSLYKTIIAYAYNLPAGNNKRIIIRTKKAWYDGYPMGWNTVIDTYIASLTNMNNTWGFFGAAIDVGGKLFTLGAAESNTNSGHGFFRFYPQNGAIPTLSLSGCKFISLDCNSSSEMLPDGCSLIVWGVRK